MQHFMIRVPFTPQNDGYFITKNFVIYTPIVRVEEYRNVRLDGLVSKNGVTRNIYRDLINKISWSVATWKKEKEG